VLASAAGHLNNRTMVGGRVGGRDERVEVAVDPTQCGGWGVGNSHTVQQQGVSSQSLTRRTNPITPAHPHQVDLKDKWRNLENSGKVLRDRNDQRRAVGLI